MMVSRFARQANMPLPKVYIVPSDGPDAFATGRNPENAGVAATEGILRLLSDEELEGVMAHELAHGQNRDTLFGTIAATFAGAIALLGNMLQWAALFGGGNNDEEGGGEMQRTAIARGLVNDPEILLADEPTGNLDSENSNKIYALLRSPSQNGLATVVITHNAELAARAQRTVQIRDDLVHP